MSTIQFLKLISNFIYKSVDPAFCLKFVLAGIKFPKKIEPFSLYQKNFTSWIKKELTIDKKFIKLYKFFH